MVTYLKDRDMKNKISLVIITLCALCMSCSNETDYFADDDTNSTSTTYYSDIVLSSQTGEMEDHITRGINDFGFTNEYPLDYIYIHSADNSTGADHKVLKVNLKEVEYCVDCRGIHLEMDVTDNGNGYTIRNDVGEEITLSENENVYFSSYPSSIWEADAVAETPITNSDVFIEDKDNVNIELLRSDIYTKDQLITLLQQPAPQIELTRHTTGYRTTVMFTNVDQMGGPDQKLYGLNTGNWHLFVPDAEPEDFYIKLYIGPNFCHSYDILNNTVPEDDQGGYYATNENQYTQIRNVQFLDGGMSGEIGDGYNYVGFGYATPRLAALLAPINTSMDLSRYSIYVFIKYMPDGGSVTDDLNAAYIQVPITDMTTNVNHVHQFIIALDVNELVDIMNLLSGNNLTRAIWNKPIEIKPKHPVKVMNIQE